MKKVKLILISLIFLGCSNSIDIEYSPLTQKKDSFLVGVWDGIINCPDCEDDKYRFLLTIKTHENETANGLVKIIKIPEQEAYILFETSISIDKNKLSIYTLNVKKEIASLTGSYWCKKNKYVLQLSSDRKKLTGEWVFSRTCNVFSHRNGIELNKLSRILIK